MKKVIITGSTGMVGKGVLLECLEHPEIEKVLVINRNPIGINHPKLKEIIHSNFHDFNSIKDQLIDYDACFHCMGVSVVGLNEDQYTNITFNITKLLVDVLYGLNPSMTFNYVSGAGTDSSEKGSTMWARVKGKTENYILNKGFSNSVMFRPGMIIPEKGIKSKTGWYNAVYFILQPFNNLLKKSKSVTTTTKIGQVMIYSITNKLEYKWLENIQINQLSEIHD